LGVDVLLAAQANRNVWDVAKGDATVHASAGLLLGWTVIGLTVFLGFWAMVEIARGGRPGVGCLLFLIMVTLIIASEIW
jgi:hypothetical protein